MLIYIYWLTNYISYFFKAIIETQNVPYILSIWGPQLILMIIVSTNLIKINISLGKGKTKFDKRESIKRKEWDREKAKIGKLSSKLK